MDHQSSEDFSFKSLFVPLTTFKAIHIIVIVGFIVFGNALFNGFVWDDKTYILFNPDIYTFNLPALFRENLFNAGGQYRAIPAIYFAFIYSFTKDIPFLYHLLQVTIHITNSILIFFLFKHFFNKKISLFLSLFFLVHPIQVESVSYIASSVNPLFFLFGITAFILSLKIALSKRRLLAIVILLLLSLLTKEAGILFVLIVFLYRFIFNKKDILSLFTAQCLSLLVYAFIRFGIGGVHFTKLSLIPIARLDFFERLSNIPAIIFYYIKTIFFPIWLSIDQQWVIPTINFQYFYFPLIISLLMLLFIGALGIWSYKISKKNFPKYLFFFLWLVVGLSLYLQIFPLDGTVADRWMYFPLVGLLGIFGVTIQLLEYKHKNLKRIGAIVLVFLVILLALRTMVRNTNWKDAVTLYKHDSTIHTNFDLENNLATEFVSMKNYGEAIHHGEKSVMMFPYEANLYNLGNIYEKKGDTKQAKEYYYKAFKAKNYLPIGHKHFLVTYVRLTYMLLLNKEYEKANEIVITGLQDYPDSSYLYIELAAIKYYLNMREEALEAATKAKILFPDKRTDYIYSQISTSQPLDLSAVLE